MKNLNLSLLGKKS